MTDDDIIYFADQVRACKKQGCLLILCEMERARKAEKELQEKLSIVLQRNNLVNGRK